MAITADSNCHSLVYLCARLAVAGEMAICFPTVFFLFFGLGPNFLESESQPLLNGSPQNLHTRLMCTQG